MGLGTIAGMAVSSIIVLIAGIAIGFLGFICITWGLALTGFMGQAGAVNTSMTTYFVLAAVIDIVTLGLSAVSVYLLAGRLKWNAAAASALSTGIFIVLSGISHAVGLIISFVVAGQLKTA